MKIRGKLIGLIVPILAAFFVSASAEQTKRVETEFYAYEIVDTISIEELSSIAVDRYWIYGGSQSALGYLPFDPERGNVDGEWYAVGVILVGSMDLGTTTLGMRVWLRGGSYYLHLENAESKSQRGDHVEGRFLVGRRACDPGEVCELARFVVSTGPDSVLDVPVLFNGEQIGIVDGSPD